MLFRLTPAPRVYPASEVKSGFPLSVDVVGLSNGHPSLLLCQSVKSSQRILDIRPSRRLLEELSYMTMS